MFYLSLGRCTGYLQAVPLGMICRNREKDSENHFLCRNQCYPSCHVELHWGETWWIRIGSHPNQRCWGHHGQQLFSNRWIIIVGYFSLYKACGNDQSPCIFQLPNHRKLFGAIWGMAILWGLYCCREFWTEICVLVMKDELFGLIEWDSKAFDFCGPSMRS